MCWIREIPYSDIQCVWFENNLKISKWNTQIFLLLCNHNRIERVNYTNAVQHIFSLHSTQFHSIEYTHLLTDWPLLWQRWSAMLACWPHFQQTPLLSWGRNCPGYVSLQKSFFYASVKIK